MVGNDIKNKSPSKNIQILKGIFIGLFGFPNALIEHFNITIVFVEK